MHAFKWSFYFVLWLHCYSSRNIVSHNTLYVKLYNSHNLYYNLDIDVSFFVFTVVLILHISWPCFKYFW